MITKIANATIYVDDQQKALDFWQNLGFEIRADNDMGNGFRWIEVAPPGAETCIAIYPKQLMPDRNSSSVVFVCDNVQEMWREMKEKGVQFKEEPKKMPWGTFAIFQDEDGNEFVLKEE